MFRKASSAAKSPAMPSDPASPQSPGIGGAPMLQHLMESKFTLNSKATKDQQLQFQDFQHRALAKLPHVLTPQDKLSFFSAAAPFIAASTEPKDAEWLNFDFAAYLLGTCFNIFPVLSDETKREYPQEFSQVFWSENTLNSRLRSLLCTLELPFRSYPDYQVFCSIKNQPILSGKREKMAVVAIDFGSTHSGFAFSLLQPPQTVVFPQGQKQPTAALFDRKTMQLICFGTEAREFFMRTLAGDMLLNKFSQTGDAAFSKEKYLYFDGDIKMRLWENAHSRSDSRTGKREDQLDAKTCRTLGGNESANLLVIVSKILERIKEDALDAVAAAMIASNQLPITGNISKDNDDALSVTSASSSPKHSISSSGSKTTRRVQADDVVWVLTVPAIWREQDKQFMRQACHNAGIIEETHSSELTMALEPECAALALKSDDLDLSPGSKLLVFDCGGGTCDVCALEVVDHPGGRFQCKLLLVPTGGDWGGRKVDERFFEFTQALFGTAILERCAKVNAAALIELQDQWERLKTQLKLDDFVDETGQIKKSIDVMYLLRESTGKSLSQLCKQFNATLQDKALHVSCKSESLLGEATLLRIPVKLIRTFFDPVVEPIVDHAGYLLRTFSSEMGNLKQLLLVGGFGSSPYLKYKIERAFPHLKVINTFRDKQSLYSSPVPASVPVERSRGPSIVGRNRNVSNASRPSNLNSASLNDANNNNSSSVLVAMGAVKFGLQPSVVRSRRARMTLGVKATVEYNSQLHRGKLYRENKFFDRESKRHYIRNAFRPILVAGEEVDSEKVVVHKFSPPNPHVDRVKFDVYTCDERAPVEFVTEEGCRLLARLYCPVVPGEMPLLEVRLKIGFTEISAEVAKGGEVVLKRVLFEFHPEDDVEGQRLEREEESQFEPDPSGVEDW